MSNDPLAHRHVTIDGYLIDASLHEDHSYPAEVTKYPIESGSSIADNVRNDPIEVTVEGIVSDTPIQTAADARSQSQAQSGGLNYLPSAEALAKLISIRDGKAAVNVTTSLKSFDSMLLEDLQIPRDPDTGYALGFTARFVQATFVTNNRVTVRRSPGTLGPKKSANLVAQKLAASLGGGMSLAQGINNLSNNKSPYLDAQGNPISRDQFLAGARSGNNVPVKTTPNGVSQAYDFGSKNSSGIPFNDPAAARVSPWP